MANKWTWKAVMGVCFMMTFGTATMITSKMMLQTEAKGLAGYMKQFNKPFFQDFAMFFAMFLCIFWFLALPKKKATGDVSINAEPEKKRGKSQYFMVAIPAFFDSTATALMTFGLIYITVSTMQMLRGSMVIFSALMTVFIRKRKLFSFQWCAVCTCLFAMILVGLSAILGGDSSGSSWGLQLLGCILVVVSQFVQASQIIVEEYLLSDINLHPLQVVGLEGMWGQIFTILFWIPFGMFIGGQENGHLEDSFDTFVMISRNVSYTPIIIVYCVAILFLNYGGMLVTAELTAVHRTIFEAVRTLCIWMTDLIIYYAFPASPYGEAWNIPWSFLELFGFACLVSSMLLYNKVFKLRCLFNYPSDAPAEAPAVEAPKEEDKQGLLAPQSQDNYSAQTPYQQVNYNNQPQNPESQI